MGVRNWTVAGVVSAALVGSSTASETTRPCPRLVRSALGRMRLAAAMRFGSLMANAMSRAALLVGSIRKRSLAAAAPETTTSMPLTTKGLATVPRPASATGAPLSPRRAVQFAPSKRNSSGTPSSAPTLAMSTASVAVPVLLRLASGCGAASAKKSVPTLPLRSRPAVLWPLTISASVAAMRPSSARPASTSSARDDSAPPSWPAMLPAPRRTVPVLVSSASTTRSLRKSSCTAMKREAVAPTTIGCPPAVKTLSEPSSCGRVVTPVRLATSATRRSRWSSRSGEALPGPLRPISTLSRAISLASRFTSSAPPVRRALISRSIWSSPPCSWSKRATRASARPSISVRAACEAGSAATPCAASKKAENGWARPLVASVNSWSMRSAKPFTRSRRPISPWLSSRRLVTSVSERRVMPAICTPAPM